MTQITIKLPKSAFPLTKSCIFLQDHYKNPFYTKSLLQHHSTFKVIFTTPRFVSVDLSER